MIDDNKNNTPVLSTLELRNQVYTPILLDHIYTIATTSDFIKNCNLNITTSDLLVVPLLNKNFFDYVQSTSPVTSKNGDVRIIQLNNHPQTTNIMIDEDKQLKISIPTWSIIIIVIVIFTIIVMIMIYVIYKYKIKEKNPKDLNLVELGEPPDFKPLAFARLNNPFPMSEEATSVSKTKLKEFEAVSNL